MESRVHNVCPKSCIYRNARIAPFPFGFAQSINRPSRADNIDFERFIGFSLFNISQFLSIYIEVLCIMQSHLANISTLTTPAIPIYIEVLNWLYVLGSPHLANMSTFQRQTPTSCYSIYSHFLFISLFALSITQCKSQSFSFSRWDGNQTYEYGSTYDKNLITVLGELVQNTPMTGLNVSSHGDSPNRVYGLLQCRGDASSEECYNCCQNVTEFVATLCSNVTECRMWYDVCELHYRNYSTSISTTSTDVVALDETTGPGTLDSTGYNTSFRKLLYNLSVEASASSKRFAAGSSVDSSGQKIYALVQCFADISTANCSYCLSKAIEEEDNYLSGLSVLSSGIYLESCFLLLSNQTSFSQTNYSKQLHVNLRVRGGVLVLITLLLLLL